MKLAPSGSETAASIVGQNEASPEELLQLVQAFNRIFDPEMQAEVIALAELHASRNPKFAEVLLKRKLEH